VPGAKGKQAPSQSLRLTDGGRLCGCLV